MVDTRESLVIDVSVKDSVTPVLPQIKQAITAMAADASKAVQAPSEAMKRSLQEATKSLGGAEGLEDLKRQFAETQGSVDRMAASLATMKAAQTEAARAGSTAVDVYLDALKRQSAALTLTNQERQEAIALLVAEKVAAENGGTPSDAQRQAIVEEIRAREALTAEREQEAIEIARSQRLNAEAVAAELAGRAEITKQLREAIVTREREAETIRRSFDASQLDRARELNKAAVSGAGESRARELAELKAAILGREAEAEAQRKGKAALDQYVGSIRDERAMLALDAREREVVLAQRRAEQLALKAGITDREKLLALVRQEVTATQQARQAALNQGQGRSSGIGSLLGALPLGGSAGQLQSFVIQARAGASALGEVGVAAGASTAALGPLALVVGAVAVAFKVASEGGQLLKESVEDSLALSDALKPIAIASAQGAAGLGALKAEIRAIAVETGRSQAEIAAAAKTVAPLGNFRQQAEVLRVGVDLARATVTQTATAVEALDRVLDAYGEGVDRARERSAQLFVGARAGEVDIQSFAQAVASVGPVAQQSGVRLEDVIRPIADIARRTGEAGQGATALSALLTQLNDPASELSVTLRRMGVDASNAAIQTRRLPAVLADIGRVLQGREDLTSQLFGKPERARAVLAALQEAGSGASSVVVDMSKSIDELTKAIQRSETATDAWGRVFAKLKSAAGLDEIGEGVEKVLVLTARGAETALGKSTSKNAADIPLLFAGGVGQAIVALRSLGASAVEEAKLAGEKVAAEQKRAAGERKRIENEALEDARRRAAEKPLPIRLLIDQAELDRSINDTFRRIGTIAPTVRLPAIVEQARRTLTDPNASKEDLQASLRVWTQYLSKVDEADALTKRLRIDTTSGLQQEIERRSQATGAIREKIDALEREGQQVDELRRLFAQYVAEQTSDAIIQQSRAFAGLQADQLAATLEMLKASEAHARAVGDVTLAETVGVAIRRESETLEMRRLAIQEADALQAQKGNSLEQEAIRARYEALRRALAVQRDTTEEVRRRAQAERTAESQRAIAGVRVSLGTGLQGELARIRQAASDERAKFQDDLRKLQTEPTTKPEDLTNALSRTAAEVERSYLLEGRAIAEAQKQANSAITDELLRAQGQVTQSYAEQIDLIVRRGDVEREAARAKLVGANASSAEIELDQRLLRIAEQRQIIEAAIQDASKSPTQRGEENLQNEAIRRTTRLLGEGKEATREWGEEFRRQIDLVRASNDALNEGLRAGIEEMRREFADNFTFGVQAAVDALRAFHDSGVSNLEDVLDGTKSLSDGLKGIAVDFLKSIRHSMLDGLFNQLGGGLSGILGGLFGGGYQLPGTLIGAPYAQGGVVPGAAVPVYQAAQGMVARSRTRLDVAEIPGLQELIAPLVGGRLPVDVDEKGAMRVRVRGAEVPVDLQGSGARRRADAAVFASGTRERSSTDVRATARADRSGSSPVTIAPGAFVVHGSSFTITVNAKDGSRAAADISAQMPAITRAIAADIERGATKALRDAIRSAAR